MELVKIIDGEPKPYSFAAFRAANKHTVYGVTISNRHLNAQDVYRVRTLPMPTEVGKKAVVQALPTLVGTEWVLDWDLVALSADEARALRDDLLASTDWTQVADAPVDQAAWATYRSLLRDVPQQSGFPNDITWPTEPEG
tara:strand:+ start:453 stop:872 length:420 start_codon:yes stop_codon:yes gene_type:complete